MTDFDPTAFYPAPNISSPAPATPSATPLASPMIAPQAPNTTQPFTGAGAGANTLGPSPYGLGTNASAAGLGVAPPAQTASPPSAPAATPASPGAPPPAAGPTASQRAGNAFKAAGETLQKHAQDFHTIFGEVQPNAVNIPQAPNFGSALQNASQIQVNPPAPIMSDRRAKVGIYPAERPVRSFLEAYYQTMYGRR